MKVKSFNAMIVASGLVATSATVYMGVSGPGAAFTHQNTLQTPYAIVGAPVGAYFADDSPPPSSGGNTQVALQTNNGVLADGAPPQTQVAVQCNSSAQSITAGRIPAFGTNTLDIG
jgi:hypothetical protein